MTLPVPDGYAVVGLVLQPTDKIGAWPFYIDWPAGLLTLKRPRNAARRVPGGVPDAIEVRACPPRRES